MSFERSNSLLMPHLEQLAKQIQRHEQESVGVVLDTNSNRGFATAVALLVQRGAAVEDANVPACYFTLVVLMLYFICCATEKSLAASVFFPNTS